MSSKQKGRFEKTKPKEEILLPPCTVKPLVVNGSRRVHPRATTQVPTTQVPDGSNESKQSTTKPLVADGSEQSLESMPLPGAEVGLVLGRVMPQVDDSRRPFLAPAANLAADDTRPRPKNFTMPLVVDGSRQPPQRSDAPGTGPAPYAEKPQVVDGSRSPLLRPTVPDMDPTLSSSIDANGSSAVFLPQYVFPGLELTPAWLHTSYFPSLSLNSSFIPQTQPPIYVYSPATFESSHPSIPLWTPLPSGSHSSPETRSPSAHSPYRISKNHTSRSATYASPSHSSLHSNSALTTSSTPFLPPPEAPAINDNPSRATSQAPPTSVWQPAEDALLRSLVHVSRNGSNDCDPPLSWTEIAERMNAHVEQHGPLGGKNDQAESVQEGGGYQQRIYHSNKLARRWGKIGGE